MTDDQFEFEHGVAIPGRILPAPEWAKTAVKRLPPPGPLDWSAIFGARPPSCWIWGVATAASRSPVPSPAPITIISRLMCCRW